MYININPSSHQDRCYSAPKLHLNLSSIIYNSRAQYPLYTVST
jgi:hypothetical protein